MQPGDWVALGAAIVAVVALIWARAQAKSAKQQADSAKEQVALAKRQTEIQEQLYRDQQQPYIWVDYRVDPVSYWLVDLVIMNEGPTTARNVKVTFDPMVKRSGNLQKKDLDSLPGFIDGFSALPPGRELRWTLGSHVSIFEEASFTRHTVTIAFDGPFGPVEPYSYVLDFGDIRDAALRNPGNIAQVTTELKEIKKNLQKGISAIQDLSAEA